MFKELAKLWHPDVCTKSEAGIVFAHLSALRRSVKDGSTDLTIRGENGIEQLSLVPVAQTDTGRRWIGLGMLGLSFEKEPDLAAVFMRNVKSLPYADSKMREQMSASFPRRIQVVTYLEEESKGPLLLFSRKQSAVMSDWIRFHGAIPPVHLAWIGSGLLNIGAWAGWSRWILPHISLDSVVINPERHNVRLIAGWEGAALEGKRPVVASNRTLKLCPLLASGGYTPPVTFTREVIRQTLREASGDPTGLMLEDRGMPRKMAQWIQSPPTPKAIDDYKAWHAALRAEFGERRFVKWDKTSAAVYAA